MTLKCTVSIRVLEIQNNKQVFSLINIPFFVECLVYTWGEGRKGQLGHGSPEAWRPQPTVVEALRGKTMTRVVAGDGFSVSGVLS